MAQKYKGQHCYYTLSNIPYGKCWALVRGRCQICENRSRNFYIILLNKTSGKIMWKAHFCCIKTVSKNKWRLNVRNKRSLFKYEISQHYYKSNATFVKSLIRSCHMHKREDNHSSCTSNNDDDNESDI